MKTQKNIQPISNFKNISIGVDIEKISRFEKYAKDKNLAEKLGIFTPAELEYCYGKKFPAQHLCARFCAKEAVYKAAVQLGFKQLPKYCEIEVLNEENGMPFINFLNDVLFDIKSRISLSHCPDIAIAEVILFV